MNWINPLNSRISKSNIICYSLIFYVIIMFAVTLLGLLLYQFSDADFTIRITNRETSIYEKITICALAVLVSPIVETLLFQKGLLSFLFRFIKNRNIVVFIGSLIFGIIHFGSLFNMIHAFINGIIYSYAFIIYRDAHNEKDAIYATTLIHTLRNITSVVVRLL